MNASTTKSPETVYQCYCERQILAAVFSTVAVIGFSGNILVLCSIITTKRLRTRTNIFVFNLAVADLITSSIMPLNAVSILNEGEYPLPNGVCVFSAFMLIVCVGTSVNSLSCIAVNRLLRITKSEQVYRRVYRKRNIIAILISNWIFPATVAMVPFVSSIGTLGFVSKYGICLWLSDSDSIIYSVMTIVVFYPIQLSLMLYSYGKIFWYVRKTSRALCKADDVQTISAYIDYQKNSKCRIELRQKLFKRTIILSKNLFFVLCAFFVCLTPYVFNLVISGPISDELLPYTGAILCVNSCLNPIIYSAKHPDFQQSFKEILCCKVTPFIPSHKSGHNYSKNTSKSKTRGS